MTIKARGRAGVAILIRLEVHYRRLCFPFYPLNTAIINIYRAWVTTAFGMGECPPRSPNHTREEVAN